MDLAWQQQRLLRNLADIDNYGGHLTGRLERSNRGELGVYRLEGWKGTQSDPLDISFLMGEDLVRPLQESGYIRVEATGKDVYEFSITKEGANALLPQPEH